jgi:hypothetical protein
MASLVEITMRTTFRFLLRLSAGLIVLGVAVTVFTHQRDGTVFEFVDAWLPIIAAMIGLCIFESFAPIKR